MAGNKCIPKQTWERMRKGRGEKGEKEENRSGKVFQELSPEASLILRLCAKKAILEEIISICFPSPNPISVFHTLKFVFNGLFSLFSSGLSVYRPTSRRINRHFQLGPRDSNRYRRRRNEETHFRLSAEIVFVFYIDFSLFSTWLTAENEVFNDDYDS